MASFPDREVHVVLTARDLGRQIPAEWQERIKHRGGRDYAAFLRALHAQLPRAPTGRCGSGGSSTCPGSSSTWGAGLPPERVHLVTVPPSGGPRGLLWERFAGVIGLDPQASYAESETTNASLGGAEVTMLRRLNIELQRAQACRATPTWTGCARPSSGRCSPSARTWCRRRCRRERRACVEPSPASGWTEIGESGRRRRR